MYGRRGRGKLRSWQYLKHKMGLLTKQWRGHLAEGGATRPLIGGWPSDHNPTG
jgi:hypothetical protein